MKEIIEKYLNGKASKDEQVELLSWLRVKGNRKTFVSYKQAWKNGLDKEQIPAGGEDSWNRIQGHYVHKNYESWQSVRKVNRYFKVAALIFFLLSVAGFAFFYAGQQSTETFTSVIADNGQVSKVVLPDSTLIWLNSGSRLIYSNLYSTKNRDVDLTGEAFFDVTENPEIPFKVSSGEIVVQVFGTEFNVNSYPESEKIDVTLVSGKVKLNSNRSTAFEYELFPGEKASFDKNSRKMAVDKVDAERLVSWKEGIINIDDLSLAELMIRLKKRYNQEFIAVEEVLNLPFTFTIKDESLEEVLELMTKIAPILVEEEGGAFTFSLDEERDGKVNK